MTLRNNGIQSNDLRNKMDNRASVALANDQLDELREKFVKVSIFFNVYDDENIKMKAYTFYFFVNIK
jgi:hypothetical protein